MRNSVSVSLPDGMLKQLKVECKKENANPTMVMGRIALFKAFRPEGDFLCPLKMNRKSMKANTFTENILTLNKRDNTGRSTTLPDRAINLLLILYNTRNKKPTAYLLNLAESIRRSKEPKFSAEE